MSHMVIYRGQDGKPGYQQADSIHDAVAFVEEMRNGDGVEQARIFRLEEVVFEYRPYYRVELSGSAGMSDGGDSAMSGPLAATNTSDRAHTSGDHPSAEVLAAVTREAPYDVIESAQVVKAVTTDPNSAVAGNGARRGLFGG